jgi:hypothetical protein
MRIAHFLLLLEAAATTGVPGTPGLCCVM